MMLRIAATMFLAALICSTADADTKSPEPPIVTYSAADPRSELLYSVKEAPVDPGTPPPTSKAETVQFAREGSSAVNGQIIVAFRSNKKIVGQGTMVNLFPNTPYVRWRIAEWAFKLDRRRGYYSVVDWEGGGLGPLPEYYTYNAGDSAVRRVHTDQKGFFRFKRVPPGDYILVAEPQVTSEYTYQTQQLYAQIPFEDGVVPVYQSVNAAGTEFYDGWLEKTRTFTLADDTNATVRQDVFNVIARFYGNY